MLVINSDLLKTKQSSVWEKKANSTHGTPSVVCGLKADEPETKLGLGCWLWARYLLFKS
jgi:hypothetical protein